MATFDRPPVIERLHNVGKRKSTTPQKFVGVYFTCRQEVSVSVVLVVIKRNNSLALATAGSKSKHLPLNSYFCYHLHSSKYVIGLPITFIPFLFLPCCYIS